MPRVQPVDPATATGESKQVLDDVRAKYGMIPNIFRGLAHSPAVVRAYLALGDALSKGVLTPKVREQIAIAVANANGCQYCVSAHTAVGKMLGVTDADLEKSREALSSDTKTQALLQLASTLIESRGWISDEQLKRSREAGISDAEIAEVVANVAQNVLTNYFNHVAETEVDFPPVALTLKQAS